MRKKIFLLVFLGIFLMFSGKVWGKGEEGIDIPSKCLGLSYKKGKENKKLYQECKKIVYPWAKKKVEEFKDAFWKNNWKKLEEMMAQDYVYREVYEFDKQGRKVNVRNLVANGIVLDSSEGGAIKANEIESLIRRTKNKLQVNSFNQVYKHSLRGDVRASSISFDHSKIYISLSAPCTGFVLFIDGKHKGKFYNANIFPEWECAD